MSCHIIVEYTGHQQECISVSVIPHWTLRLDEEGGPKKNSMARHFVPRFRSQPQTLIAHLPIALGLVAGMQQVFLIYIERSQILDSGFSGFTHIHSPFPLYFSFSLLLHIPVSSLLPTNSPTRTHTHRFKDFLFIKRPAKSQSQSQIQSQPFGVAVTAKTKKRFPWPPASSSSPSPSLRSSSLCLVQGDKMVFLHGVGEIVNHDIISKEDVMSKHPTRLGRARLWLAQVVFKNRSQSMLDLPKKRENFSWRLLAFWFVFLLGPWSRDP